MDAERILRPATTPGHGQFLPISSGVVRVPDTGFDAHLIKPVALDALEQVLTRLRASSG
ncbi:MAG: hypothetical protein ACODAG_08160 [Myxococcota bacterium]